MSAKDDEIERLKAENKRLKVENEKLKEELVRFKEPAEHTPKGTVKDWVEEGRKFRAAYPGHCSGCGLSKKACFHLTPEYDAYRRSYSGPTGDMRALIERNKGFYREALAKLSVDELNALPPPPKPWQERILKKYKAEQSTVWDRLGDDA